MSDVIAEAAKAIAEFAAHDGPVDAYHLAKVLHARFEEAHAPTVIERHDLVMPIYVEQEPYSWDCERCGQDPEDCYCEGPGDEYEYRIVNKFYVSEPDVDPAQLRRLSGVEAGDVLQRRRVAGPWEVVDSGDVSG